MAKKAAKGLMPMSGRGVKPFAEDAGFTLIEALMALFIFGLLAGAVALSAPAPDSRARAEAQTFAARLMMASDESLTRNRSHALLWTNGGYSFVRLEAEGWRPFEERGALDFRAWPPGVTAEVLDPMPEDGEPMVAQFDPMGAATPLVVRVHGGSGSWLVRLDANGGAHVSRAP